MWRRVYRIGSGAGSTSPTKWSSAHEVPRGEKYVRPDSKYTVVIEVLSVIRSTLCMSYPANFCPFLSCSPKHGSLTSSLGPFHPKPELKSSPKIGVRRSFASAMFFFFLKNSSVMRMAFSWARRRTLLSVRAGRHSTCTVLSRRQLRSLTIPHLPAMTASAGTMR